MHIILSSEELKDLDINILPNETTLVETNNNGKPIKSYKIENGSLNITNDFIENSRKWLEGEEEEFIKGKTREDVIEYFLCHDDNMPQREHRTMRNLEYNLFSFIRSSGMYKYIDDDTRYNLFSISISRNSDLNKAGKEISWALNKIAQFYKDIPTIEIDVSEHTFSEYCSYIVLWDRNKKFELCAVRFEPEVIKEFSSLSELIKYISIHHYYE